jgi:enamine deaminase RidA (YjgF/YER057c/UK114 family)
VSRPAHSPERGTRRRYSSGTVWEREVGYSRAVRVGGHVYVSGTTATGPDGRIVAPDDPYRQTVQILDNIERALTALGSERAAIVRLRMFVRSVADFPEIARALGERFREVRPAATLVEVSGLVDPAMRLEIEAEADDLPSAGRARPRSRGARPARGRRAPGHPRPS